MAEIGKIDGNILNNNCNKEQRQAIREFKKYEGGNY